MESLECNIKDIHFNILTIKLDKSDSMLLIKKIVMTIKTYIIERQYSKHV